jgi:tungstate transport system permease protein
LNVRAVMFDDVLRNAWHLVITFDPNVFEYAVRSLIIATISTLVAGVIGIPIGILIGEHDFVGKRAVVTILNTLLALPTVVVGLTVYMFLSRQGPWGHLELLFTVPGIIIGEVLLIIPLITALTVAAISRTGRDVRKTALALGASSGRAYWTVICESRFGVLAAIVAAFGRVVSEVGVATILGGNIDRFTRTMTTAIVRYVDMGEFALALALGILLLAISLSINIVFQYFQGGGRE